MESEEFADSIHLIESHELFFNEGMRIAALLRISEKKKIENTEKAVIYDFAPKLENQDEIIRRIIDANKLTLVKTYSEIHTGREGESDRKVLREIFEDAEKGMFEVLIVYACDRITREGGWELVGYVRRLNKQGVQVYSHIQGWLDLSTPMKEFVVYAHGLASRLESDMNSFRTKRSRERRIREAKFKGVAPKLGGWEPVQLTDGQLLTLQHMRSLGYSMQVCAEELAKENPKITESVIKRVLKAR